MTKDEALRLALDALSPDPYRSEWAVEEDKCKAIIAIKAALEAKDEPVAWMVYTQEGQSAFVTDNPAVIHPSQRALPLYATPQWVGLTDEEVNTIYEQAEVLVNDSWVGNGTVGLMFPITLYKMFEAKLKEKNHA